MLFGDEMERSPKFRNRSRPQDLGGPRYYSPPREPRRRRQRGGPPPGSQRVGVPQSVTKESRSQRELSVEGKELQEIVPQVDSPHQHNVPDDAQQLNAYLTAPIGMIKSRTSNNTINNSFLANASDSSDTSYITNPSDHSYNSDREPLWKRRLKRAKSEETNAATSTTRSRVKVISPKTSAPTASPPTAQPRASPTVPPYQEYGPEDEEDKDSEIYGPAFINDGPSDNRRHVYSRSKSAPVENDGSTAEFKLATPLIYTDSTQPVSFDTRKPLENQQYTPANDSVSSLGEEEEANVGGDCVDNALLSVASLTSVALESVAAFIQDCNENYTNADID